MDEEPIGSWTKLAPVDGEEGERLVQRLRFAADTLHMEFEAQLSRADAERLIFTAAQDILSASSVTHFVPTFAERRARRFLHDGRGGAGVPTGTDSSEPEPSEPEPSEPEPSEWAPAQRGPAASQTEAPGDPPSGPWVECSVPPWPDDFYSTEAKRLLERARTLRGAGLAGGDPAA